IQTGREGEQVELALLRDFQQLRHVQVDARSSEGLVAIDLLPFLADARAAGAVHYRLLARIAGENLHVADVRVDPQLRIRAVNINSLDDSRVLEVMFSQAFAMGARLLRAWDLARPWAPPIELEIPADVVDGRWV